MYENLMEEVVGDENLRAAMRAVKRNQGAPGIDHMKTTELEGHIQKHWEKIRAKLLAGTWVPSPVKRVEIPKPSGGTRKLGIPTVVDRLIQQMLLQVMTPIFEPMFSEHSYGFRPGRSAHDAVRAAQQHAREGKEWVVDIDITKFLDSYSQCSYGSSKRPGGGSNTLIRKPLRCPCRTWRASSSPLFTRCHKLCRDTPSRRMASTTGT
jgi:RNA-directed DNA polymerase